MILFYEGNDPETAKKLKVFFEQEKLPVLLLAEEDLSKTMEQLLKKTDSTPASSYSRPAFLFYENLSRNEIEELEKKLNLANANIPYKAVATEHNASWPLAKLMDEVQKEAAYFQKREHLYDLIVAADRDKLESDEHYKTMMLMAYALLEEEQLEEDVLDIAIEAIENYK
jgi:hypothetical protein